MIRRIRQSTNIIGLYQKIQISILKNEEFGTYYIVG
jgi:hypothetical protein